MAERISLVEQYSNKDVIQQIYTLKTANDGWDERIASAEQASGEALSVANSFGSRIGEVEESNTRLDAKVGTFDARITHAEDKADDAMTAVDTRVTAQELKGLTVSPTGTGAYSITADKQNGDITSNTFNVSKVTSASIGKGSLANSIYLQLNLSDGTVVRTNDTVLELSGVEADIHVTSIVLEDAPDAHTIKAIFTYNNGQSISSNTLTYDYPDKATNASLGLVKGNDVTGGVKVDSSGNMTVVGWDGLLDQTDLTDINGRIDAKADRTEVEAVETAQAAVNTEVSGRLETLEAFTEFGGVSGVLNDVTVKQVLDFPEYVRIDLMEEFTAMTEGTPRDLLTFESILTLHRQRAEGAETDTYNCEYINTLEDTLTASIDAKQDKLTAGTGISIVDGVISVNLSNANGVSF